MNFFRITHRIRTIVDIMIYNFVSFILYKLKFNDHSMILMQLKINHLL